MGESMMTKWPPGRRQRRSFVQCSPVIRRVMNGSIEDRKIETRCAERQMVKLRFDERGTVAVVAGSAQAIHRIRKNIERHRPMLPQSKPIGHPAIPRAEIQHIECAAVLPFDVETECCVQNSDSSCREWPTAPSSCRSDPDREARDNTQLPGSRGLPRRGWCDSLREICVCALIAIMSSARKRTDGGRTSRAAPASVPRADRKHPASGASRWTIR